MGLMPLIFTAITIFASAVFILIVVSYISYKLKSNKDLPYAKMQQPAFQTAAPKMVQRSHIPEMAGYPVYTKTPQAPAPRRIQYVPEYKTPRFQVMQSQNHDGFINYNQTKPINFPRYAENNSRAEYNIFHNYSNENLAANGRAQRY